MIVELDLPAFDPSAPLLEALEDSASLGFLGPGPVAQHLLHAVAMACAVEHVVGSEPDPWLDLGSGGGLPGLVLLERWTGAGGHLLDSARRRTEFLGEAAGRMGVADRVTVHCGRAEELGRNPRLREQLAAVVARSFAPPPVTAECGSPFLRVDGWLVVSEPPGGDPARWPPDPLSELGLEVGDRIVVGGQHTFQALRKALHVPDRFPRPTGRPGKRPLY